MDEKKQLIEENKEIVKGLIIERKKLTIQLDQVSYLIQGYENTIKKLEEEKAEEVAGPIGLESTC